MRMVDLIAKKRLGESHTQEEINFIINGLKDDFVQDSQLTAWLMAVCFQGMTPDECSYLTHAMAHSGDILGLSDIGSYVIDKHSTGGVGDKTTLIIVPLLAAAGLPVAKLSGRGLGYTGGTIDKLESIPGLKTSLELDEFISQVKSIGGAIASQTGRLAPADGKIYALRDVTATVDSIPLIASSVVSKKIASGANVIILDVKCGSGAFMKSIDDAEKLSEIMVHIGKSLNKSICAMITHMEQPLGQAIGNNLEVIESIKTLKNQGPQDLTELCLYLAGMALLKTGKAKNITSAKQLLRKHLEDGSAFNKFKEVIKAQGGDLDFLDDFSKFPAATCIEKYTAKSDGYISKIKALDIAKASKILGAGREKKGDKIDHSVGIVVYKKIGEKVKKGELLAEIHSNKVDLIPEAMEHLDLAYEFSDNPVESSDLIYKIIE